MKFLLIIMFTDSKPPITDVNSILAWIIGVLILFCGVLFTYFKGEIKTERTSRSNANSDNETRFNNLQTKYDNLVLQSKEDNKDTVKLMTEVQIFMKNNITITTSNAGLMSEMKQVLNLVSSKIDNLTFKMSNDK